MNDSPSDVPWNNGDEDLASGSGGGNQRGQDKLPGCVSGNYTFHSIDDILNNISSNNTIVNITTDVVLSSNVTLEGLENIMIIGHRNPVVKCNDVGAVKFISCKNITIEGIQWEGCGSKDYPGVEFYNSFNFSFERCSFHNSKGKSVLLSQVSGNVYIKNCNFTHKIKYSGHGAAIHYSTFTTSHGQHKLVVQNSLFIFNRATQSVVYIDGSGSQITGHVYLQDDVFVNNTGVPIYVSHNNLHISGNVSFKDNTAKSGGGIFSNNCYVILYDISDVNFIGNSVTVNGGAIYHIYTRIIFEENSTVTFKDNSARSGGAIYSDNSDITFDGNSSVTFNNNEASFGGAVYCKSSSNIIFDGNAGGTFNNNEASDDGGAIYCKSSSHITFDGNSSVTFNSNEARYWGGAVLCYVSTHITFDGNTSVTFNNNEASDDGGAVFCWSSSPITFDSNSIVKFNNNGAGDDGGAIYCKYSSLITFDGNSSVTFNNNEANFGGAVYCKDSSHITFDGTSSVTFNNNEASDHGGSVFCISSSHITFDINSSVHFTNNNAYYYGGAVYCENLSHITFDGNSNVTFDNNEASVFGGAINCVSSSHIIFGSYSSVTFNSNTVSQYGGAVYCGTSSHITFNSNSSVTFKDNRASDYGGAVFCLSSSNITFDGNSSVTFNNNSVSSDGGAVSVRSFSYITFDGNSNVTFNNNEAGGWGGAVLCSEDSTPLIFDGNSSVTFNNNKARHGAAVYCRYQIYITFDGNSRVTFNSNEARFDGGAVYVWDFSSRITFDGNSIVTINNNKAKNVGGAVYCASFSHITFDGNSSVTFNNNEAIDGGAVHCEPSSHITFDGNSNVAFHNNRATDWGGAVYCAIQCDVQFYERTLVTFINNSAVTGGAILSQSNSYISAQGNSTVKFIQNTAIQGGAIYSSSQATVLLEENCVMTFKDNKATESGGALYITAYSTAIFTGHSEVTYSNNEVTQYGGAIYCSDNSNIILDESISIEFTNNTSEYGGAMSITHSFMIFEGNSLAMFTDNIAERGGTFYMLLSIAAFKGNISVNFSRNTAKNGGAISAVKSSITLAEKSQLYLLDNSATGNGGAMHLSDNFTVNISHNSHVTFYHNTADRHGGAIYCDLTKSTKNKIAFSTTDIVFDDNTDLTGSDVYVDMPTSCDEMCFNNSIINKGYNQFVGVIKTSPRKLEFNDSAVTCIDDDNDTNCQTYLTRNIMLGQEIIINACVRDYYNQSAESTQFVLSSDDQDHINITGPDNVLLSCTLFEGVSIKGEKILDITNYSMTITSYDGSKSDLNKFSIDLITEFSPCHPGFHYDNNTQKCVCYGDSDIVSCSGSSSSIKIGYWFGEVDDKATVTTCPNIYCNFSCCETANGYFKLSPVRANQCNAQRSGTACGGCEEGFTLSFDSIECVSVDTCTTGQTALVVTLSILYWVVIVILMLIVTYYHIGIGYLYAITYYYSMVDILLSEHLYISQGLYTVVSIMSSIAKVTPQFLGQLCLVTNMSGIDQQFIHYAHPLAVAIIITMICLSARLSYKFSSFVSRGIIHNISFLLLPSYTSMVTTSLLLLRSLTFHNVDKVYTYLSPDIEYFHSRHLPYVIIAMICSVIIVMGLPLLLLLEPFLNHKINFNRIKPLLDQFQGCYKDKYRSFAAYYMICRLVIILITVTNPSSNNTTQYLLIIANSTLALVHVTIKPYESNILNVFDGFVLQLMIVVSMVPLIDSNDPDLLLSFMFVLVILPLIPFLIMEIYLHKKTIKKIIKYCVPPKPDTTNDNNELPMREEFVDSVIDDSRRVNATIVEM